MKVKAKAAVFYKDKRYEVGDTLEISKESFNEHLFDEVEEVKTTKKKVTKEAEISGEEES